MNDSSSPQKGQRLLNIYLTFSTVRSNINMTRFDVHCSVCLFNNNEIVSSCSEMFRHVGLICTTASQTNVPIQSQKYILHSHRSGDVYSIVGLFNFQSHNSLRIFRQLLYTDHNHQYSRLLHGISAQNGIHPKSDRKISGIHS